jgi:hypothetical protein
VFEKIIQISTGKKPTVTEAIRGFPQLPKTKTRMSQDITTTSSIHILPKSPFFITEIFDVKYRAYINEWRGFKN